MIDTSRTIIMAVGRVNELANSEPNKVYIRITPEDDSQGMVALRVERPSPHCGVSAEGLSIGQRVRISMEVVDA